MSAGTRKRGGLRLWLAGGALGLAGAGFALGPGAAWIVDHVADGQRVWRLGRIQVEGVSGSWIGALRADRVSIADATGVWIEAEDLVLDWRPLDLLRGAVNIEDAEASRIRVLRRPALSEPRQRQRATLDVRIGSMDVAALDLETPVLGQGAAFVSSGSLEFRDGALQQLALELRRTDAEGDYVSALYRADALQDLRVDALGAAGGVFSRALGVAEQDVRAQARGDGDARTGEARFDLRIGPTTVVDGATRWTPAGWSLAAQAKLRDLPGLSGLARRIGAHVALSAEGARVGAFSAHAETPFLAVQLMGELDAERRLAGPAQITASTPRLSDIAREAPFELGAAELRGELRRSRGVTAIQATFDAREIDALGRRVRLSGPVRASLSSESFDLEADLRAPQDAPPLFAQARLRTRLNYDRRRARFQLDRSTVEGEALAFDAQGWSARGDGEFSGEWRVRRLAALSGGLAGEAGGRWRAFREDKGGARVWTAAIDGRAGGLAGEPSMLAQALGPAPRLDARISSENGGLSVTHARIDGRQLRAGVCGHVVRGDAALSLEASARGPLSLGGAEIAGAMDARGAITGRITRPSLALRATLARLDAGPVRIEQPAVELTLAPARSGYAGRVQVAGATAGRPLAAAADVNVADATIGFTNIEGDLGGLAARGAAQVGARGVSADLRLTGALDALLPGVSGRVDGALALTPETLTLDAELANVRSGELYVRAAAVRAEGPPNALSARFDLRGRLGRAPLAFSGVGALASRDGATTLSLEGRGVLAGADIFTRSPISARFENSATEASLNVAIGDGVVGARWRERGRALSGSAQIEDAPLAPLAAIWGERAEGRIDGLVRLESAGAGLRGEADLDLESVRFAGRQRQPLDLRLTGRLEPDRLRAVVDASSPDGLRAHFEADAPVATAADPLRIALAPERRGQARWSVRGPAASLWAAARLPDQNLEGEINGEGELQFGAGYLSGEGGIEIANGRFEDKLSGITLVDLDARIALDQRGLTIERFSAGDGHGGRLTATGGSATQRQGRITVAVEGMRVADRADARATASGDLLLAWEGLESRLTGDLAIDAAELDVAANPQAGIATIDVVEINLPDRDGESAASAPARTNGSTRLDVRVRAPGRVFTRGRGLDAEWSLDLRLSGTAHAPQLTGEARAVRGSLALSGQPFEIDAARISFSGDPLDAQIELTATRATPELTATVRLLGTARDPEVSFTSDPALPEDEILPQVLFGRSVEDLSVFEAAQLAASLAALSGRASLDLVGAARAAAGLDRFNVRQDQNGGFLVAGGVYLTRDVYVEVARTGLGETQSRVEWLLAPRLVLITSFLGDGDQNVSLRWRRESD